MPNLYNCNAIYIDSVKAGLPAFISLGILHVVLPIWLNFSEIQLTLLLLQEYSPGAVRLQEAGQTGGTVGEGQWSCLACAYVLAGHCSRTFAMLTIAFASSGKIQNCGCLEQCVHLQAVRHKITVTRFLTWFNGKVQLGLLGSTSCLGLCLSKESISWLITARAPQFWSNDCGVWDRWGW